MTFAKYCRLTLEAEYDDHLVADMVERLRPGIFTYTAVEMALEEEHGKPTDPAAMTESEKMARLKKYGKIEEEERLGRNGKYTRAQFPKKITRNTRNAFLREQLQTTAKVTGTTVPVDAKQLAKDYSSDLLKEVLKLRLKQEARDRARTPRMRHFKRIGAKLERWSERWDGPLNENDGRLMYKPHVCVPECGMYSDAEADALLKNSLKETT